jgi:hypothetical protein
MRSTRSREEQESRVTDDKTSPGSYRHQRTRRRDIALGKMEAEQAVGGGPEAAGLSESRSEWYNS